MERLKERTEEGRGMGRRGGMEETKEGKVLEGSGKEKSQTYRKR